MVNLGASTSSQAEIGIPASAQMAQMVGSVPTGAQLMEFGDLDPMEIEEDEIALAAIADQMAMAVASQIHAETTQTHVVDYEPLRK